MMFNETLTEPRSYADFIEKLRRKVVHDNCTSAGGVPMLPPKEGHENNYFHIILKDKDKINEDTEITLQIQQVNLYLVAFKGTNGQWYACRPEENSSYRPPPNSKLLPFTARYPPNDAVVKITVGRVSLKDAISGLAKYHENENQPIDSFFMTLAVMFPEAIRFKRVAEFVNPCMLKPCDQEPEIGIAIAELIRKWKDISYEMRQYDQFGNWNPILFKDKDLNITTVKQAKSTVGILLYQEVPPILKTHTKGADKKK